MKDDNLFADSSMSIGEHLEELRKCIIFSLCWVIACTAIGFYFGADIVRYIQIPVNKSLDQYYKLQSQRRLEADKQQLQSEGYTPEVVKAILDGGFVPEERYLFAGELERILNQQKNNKNADKNTDKNTDKPDVSFSLNEVDNLTEKKAGQNKKRAEAGFTYDTIQFDEKPIRVLFLKKTSLVTQTRSLGAYEAFGIYIKVSVITGLVLALPFIAVHIWSFIAAGLYPHEKRYVYYFVPASVLLFIGGVLFAFFCVFQLVLNFLFEFNAWMNIEPDLRISEWIGFAFMLPVGFGLSFQLPVVMFVLERVGIFSFKQYFSYWRPAILIIFAVSLMLTPGDPGSMVMMALPLTFLYFAGASCCMLFPRQKTMFDYDEEEDAKFNAVDS
ncbi:MAG: twin-arginine translocase subunit TatC [Planctomycetaceae bacterium]|jgi:sec-independent protein translocase protein TatC|nr:twin-arginine translocase subunit TatC [Planctomycetaceae bacterium]